MSSNRSNERADRSRDDKSRGSSSRDDYTRANNDSLGESSRSGRGGSWSHLDDDDRASDRSASRSQNPPSNGDMGADSWGGASDRDTGRERYNSDGNSSRDDHYGNRNINDDNYSSGRYGQMKGDRDDQHRSSDSGRDNQSDGSNRQQSEGTGRFNSRGDSNSDGERSRGGARDTNYGDRYTGREGGSNQFSSWQNDPSDVQSRSTGGSPSRSQASSSSASQFGMSRGQHAGRGPKGYRRDDTRITEDVNEAFTRDSHLDASEIEVKVANGEVTLTGTVDSRDAKRHAEDIAESVSGVNDVNNQIKVSKGPNSGHASPSGDHAHSMTSGASSTSTSSTTPSGKTSPSTSGASTNRTGDKGSNS